MRNPALVVSPPETAFEDLGAGLVFDSTTLPPKPTYQPVIPSDLRMRRLAARADDLYREIRVENDATGKSGEKFISNPKR